MAVHSPFLAGLTADERSELEGRLHTRQSRACFICEKTIDLDLQADQLEIDHVIPVATSGKDEENNFALTHEHCNRRKSASDLRVARVLARFDRIVQKANRDRGAHLGDVLAEFGGATKSLRIRREPDTVSFSIPGDGGATVTQLPVWRDPLSGMEYFFALLPLSHLHHDSRINPRGIGVNIRGLIEEFHLKRPQLHVALAWWSPEAEDEGTVNVFDGQHKAAAQILLGTRLLPIRVFLRPDLRVLLEANTNAGDKLKQVAFDAAVKRHLGSSLYRERVEDFQKLRNLSPHDFSFSERDLVTVFKGEHREVVKYILDAVRDRITRDPGNRLMDYVEWAGKTADLPLSYSTVEKTFYSELLHMRPLDTPLEMGMETGLNPRHLEHEQMVRLMSLFARIFFDNSWNPDVGGRKLEDRVLKGEHIDPKHLRAWRIAREEVLVNVLKYIRLAIEHYYAMNQEMVDKERLMHHRFPDVLWSTIEAVLRNIGDLPCWVDTKLSQTIFGGKPNRDFWKKIFKDGISPTGIQVLARGLELRSLVTPRVR